MTRLTNDIRDAIRADLTAHRYGAAVKAIGDRLQVFAAKLYDHLYSPEDQALMASLPNGWLPEDDHLRISYAGQYHSVYFNGYCWSWSSLNSLAKRGSAISRRVASEHIGGHVRLRDDALCNEFGQIDNDLRKLNEANSLAQRDIQTALSTFSTIEKLIEAWPEVEPFASPYITAPQKAAKSLLPAVRISSLNAMLDLPVEQ